MPAHIEITPEEKRQALERVLRSETFSRSEQLRRFLRFICECEIDGRADDITEYSIAVEALGRRPDYSPNVDSSVRNRAHALRHKLEEYYSSEGSADPVQIIIPKGSYVPKYGERPTTPVVRQHVPVPAEPESEILYRRIPPVFTWRALVASVIAAAILSSTSVYLVTRKPDPVEPVIREAWGPLLAPQANTTLCIGTPAHMFIRPYREGRQPTYLRLFDVPAGAYANYRGRLENDQKLYMLLTQNSPLWGDSIGMATTSRLLAAAGTSFETVPERLISSVSALRDRNLVVFGTPEYSAMAAHLLNRTPFTVGFDEDIKEHVVIDRRENAGDSRLPPDRDRKKAMVHTWGLITVLPSEGTTGAPKQTIVFSGISSAGTQAAVEYFTSPHHLKQLKARFHKEGLPGFPSAYQVVVETDVAQTIPLKVHYRTHAVIPKSR